MKQQKQDYRILQYQKPNYLLQFLANAVFLVLAVISVALLSFSYVYMSAPVYGVSMQPTLNAQGEEYQDTVYINRFASFAKGDIIVIEKESESKNIIKRVIATAGDTVNIVYNAGLQSYELYVNNVLQNEPYVYGYPTNTQMSATYENFEFLKQLKPELFDAFENLVVPQGQVFALGDHRAQSTDSAYDGPYNISSVVGKVDFVVPNGQNQIVYFLNVFTPFTV